MKASEAAELVKKFHAFDDMSVAFEKIRQAASEGRRQIYFYAPSVTDKQRQILEEHGYIIQIGFQSDQMMISW